MYKLVKAGIGISVIHGRKLVKQKSEVNRKRSEGIALSGEGLIRDLVFEL